MTVSPAFSPATSGAYYFWNKGKNIATKKSRYKKKKMKFSGVSLAAGQKNGQFNRNRNSGNVSYEVITKK